MRRLLPLVVVALALLTPLWAQLPTLPQRLKTYTPEEVRRHTLADLYMFLQYPQAGYQTNAAALALQARAEADPKDRTSIEAVVLQMAQRVDLGLTIRSRAFYLLSSLNCAAAVPYLAEVLQTAKEPQLRAAAATALGGIRVPGTEAALKGALAKEADEMVLTWVRRALERLAQPPREAPQKLVRFWLVKDWVRLRNTGLPAEQVEFRRFFPLVDEEQLVLGRWIEAHDDAGTTYPVSLLRVDADADANLIHTFRLDKLATEQEITVCITALVARRARPPVQPPQPLPETVAGYPEGVRDYLASTAMVSLADPLVRQYAGALLARGRDGYEIAAGIADLLKAVKPVTGENLAKHPGMGVSEFVLRYGGMPGQCAVAAAALCRACGLPAQLTYYPSAVAQPVVDVYFSGYGWSRMMPQTGMATLPPQGYAMPRIYNLPLEAENEPNAYLAPFNSWDKTFVIRASGTPCPAIRTWNAVEDKRLKQFAQPFPHYECGIDCRSLGDEPYADPWLAWDDLAALSLQAAQSLAVGPFTELGAKLPAVASYAEKALNYKEAAAGQ